MHTCFKPLLLRCNVTAGSVDQVARLLQVLYVRTSTPAWFPSRASLFTRPVPQTDGKQAFFWRSSVSRSMSMPSPCPRTNKRSLGGSLARFWTLFCNRNVRCQQCAAAARFIKINPNGRIPAIGKHDGTDQTRLEEFAHASGLNSLMCMQWTMTRGTLQCLSPEQS